MIKDRAADARIYKADGAMSQLAVKLRCLKAQKFPEINGGGMLSMVPLNNIFGPRIITRLRVVRRMLDDLYQNPMERAIPIGEFLGCAFVRLADPVSDIHAEILP